MAVEHEPFEDVIVYWKWRYSIAMLVYQRLIWKQKMIISKRSCLSNFRVNQVKLKRGERWRMMGWLWGGDSPDSKWCRFKLALFESGWFEVNLMSFPWGSMYGIFPYIYHENQPNVGKYTIHGSYGFSRIQFDVISFVLLYVFLNVVYFVQIWVKMSLHIVHFKYVLKSNMIWHNTIQFNLDKTRSDNEHLYVYIYLLWIHQIYIFLHLDALFCVFFTLQKKGKQQPSSGSRVNHSPYPYPPYYVIFTYVEQQFMPNVGKFSIHGSFGIQMIWNYERQPFIQDIPNRTPTERAPKKTWVCNSSIATYWKGSVGIRSHSIFAGIDQSHSIHVWYPRLPNTLWGGI